MLEDPETSTTTPSSDAAAESESANLVTSTSTVEDGPTVIKHQKTSSYEDGFTKFSLHSKSSSLDLESKDPKRVFDVDEVKSVVKETVEFVMQDSAYLHTRVSMWNTNIVNGCLEKLKGLGKSFKYVVICTIVQKNGAGLHATSSCYWDPTYDDSASYRHELNSMYVIVNVFGLCV